MLTLSVMYCLNKETKRELLRGHNYVSFFVESHQFEWFQGNDKVEKKSNGKMMKFSANTLLFLISFY